MSTTPISGLPTITTPSGSDYVPIVDNTQNPAVTSKITVANLMSGSGAYVLTPYILTVNGSTTVFAVPYTPVFIVADGETMTTNNGFTYSGTTLTMSNPPQGFAVVFYNAPA